MFDVDMLIDDILNEIGNAQQHFIRIERINSKAGLPLVMHGMGDDKTNSPNIIMLKKKMQTIIGQMQVTVPHLKNGY